jgi:hypothetical protein
MKAELAAWNNSRGIDLESWIGCAGNFSLAVGYAALFWPELVEFDRYILRKDFSESALRGFESQPGSTRSSIEQVMNHVHIADLHHAGSADISKDKLMQLGHVLKEMLQAKLQWQFPQRTFVVSFHVPEDKDDLLGYELSFWQETSR